MRYSVTSWDTVLTLVEAKAHLKVDFNDDDTQITNCLKSAIDEAEALTDRAYATATYKLALSGFPSDGVIELRPAPLVSVTSVIYQDSVNAEQTLAATNYIVDTISVIPKLSLAADSTWPSTYVHPNAVVITWVAGGSVPERAKQLVRFLLTKNYDKREGSDANLERAIQDCSQSLRAMGV